MKFFFVKGMKNFSLPKRDVTIKKKPTDVK